MYYYHSTRCKHGDVSLLQVLELLLLLTAPHLLVLPPCPGLQEGKLTLIEEDIWIPAAVKPNGKILTVITKNNGRQFIIFVLK